MKIVKRALSVFLAFLMIFSSVSLLASAELNDGQAISSEFRIEYWRNAGTKESPDWKKTDAIKRGDQLQVRVYITSDYEVAGSELLWVYAKDFMTLDTEGWTKNGTNYDISNVKNTSATSIPGANGWTGFVTTATEPGGYGATDAAALLVMDGYLDEEFFDDKGWITIALDGGSVDEVKLTDDEHIFEFTFTVNADSTTEEGFMYVPEGSLQNTTTHDWAYGYLGKAESLTDPDYAYIPGYDIDYHYTLNDKDTISTKSKVILNAGDDGYFGATDVKTAYTAEEIGTTIAVPTTVPTPVSATKVFKGWALADDATQTVLTADDFAAMEYGYNNINLTAVYEAAGATYDTVVVKQNADGTWPTDKEIAEIKPVSLPSSDGVVIKASDYKAEAGFHVENTTDEITVSATEVKTLTVRLARDTVKVTFDGADEISGLYGATVTAPVKTTASGYTNSGWYTVDGEGNKTLAVEEGKEFTLPATSTNYVSDVTADKQDVTVNVVYYDTIAKENKTVHVTFEDATVTGGEVEIVEAVPAQPVEGVTYILLSEIAAKANLEHYAYDAGSSLENLKGSASATGLTLTVGYEAVEYAVTFDTAVDGVADVSANVAYGSTVAADALPTEEALEAAKPGYEFEGWFTTVDGAEVEFVPGTSVVTGPATYTAKFTANQVKITYAYEGADIPAGDEYALPANRTDAVINETFTLPAITAPDGYTLKWNVEGATKVDATTYKVGTTDVTVTGTWTLNTYTITYYYWDEMTDADLVTTEEVKYKDAIPDVTAEYPGYVFSGWDYYVDNDPSTPDEVDPDSMPAHDLYAVAMLTQIGYGVQFMKYDNIVGGETEEEKAASVFDSSDETIWNDFVYITTKSTDEEGYNFTGWVFEDGTDAGFPMYVDESWRGELSGFKSIVKVYAVYQPKTINVEFAPNGGYFDNDVNATASKLVPTVFGEEIIKDAYDWNIARDHYTFSEWLDWYDGITVESENVKFEAIWLPNVEYAFAGTIPAGVDVPATVEGAEYGEIIDVPALEAAGYSYTVSYSGDYTDEGEGIYTVKDTPVTVTYNWTADGDVAYTVETYLENLNVTDVDNLNNYTLKDTLTRTGSTGGAINFQEDLYKGFTFYKQVEADATIGGDGKTVVKVYYTRDTVKVTITDENGDPIVDENGNPIVDGEYDYGDTIPEPTEDQQPDTTEPGKEFDEWTYEDGTPVEWPLIVDSEDPIVIVPSYKDTLYSITYKSAGVAAPEGFELPGGEYVDVEDAIYGDDVPVPAWNNDTVPGYNVTITVENALDEGEGVYTVEESDVTVTATWSYDVFTVTYVTVGTAPDGYVIPNAEFANNNNATIGTKVAVPAWTAPDGYAFELKVEGAERQNDGSHEVYNSNVTVTATWTQLTGIAYTVETYLENLNVEDHTNLDNYTLEETLTRTGKTGDAINFTEDLYEGFTFYKQVEADATIGGDGKTVVKVYYTRDTVKITVKDENGNEITDENGDPIFDGEYDFGDEITEPTEDKQPAPTEPGTEFDKWVDENGDDIVWPLPVDGEEDIVIIPTYKNIDYKVTYVTDAAGIKAPANYELPNATYANTEVAHYGDTVAVPAWNNDTVAGYNVTITVTGAVEANGAYTVGEGDVTVTATWSYDEYALTYSYDASAPAGAAVPEGEDLYVGKVVTLATPADVAGYTFAGWVIDGTTYAAGASYTAGAADAEAIGSWTAKEGITYFIRRHFEVLGEDGVYGEEEKLITKTGKAGDAISYSEKVEGFDFFKQEPADATIGGDGKTVVDVYYNRKTVTVTVYEEDGVTKNDELSGEYEYGSSIPEPKDDPVSEDEGKSFDQWVYEDGTPVTWPIKIENEDPIVIKPTFYNNTYTVRFLISADKLYTEDTEAEYSTTITKPEDPDPTKVGMTGYTFVEWRRGSVNGAAWTAEDTVPVNGVDYYAYFTPNSNITYKINKYFQNVELTDWDYSLTKVETVTDATAGVEVTLDLDKLFVKGFTIDEANSVIKQVINGNGTTEFVVYYLRNKTTVNIDGVDEDVIFGDKLTEDEVEEIIKENGTYDEGYEYTGWEDENGNPVTFPYEIPATGGKLTPVYTLKSFTVTFVDDKGGEVKSEKVEYKSVLADVTPAYPVKEGYTPTGWFDVADGTVIPATMPAKDVTYKVGYTNVTNTAYTITIYVMDLEGNYTIKTSTTAYGTTGDTAMIVPEEQIGLYEDTTHADRNLSAVIAADGSTELRIFYAREKYTVTYDGTSVEAFYGSAIPAPAADPVAPGKGKEFAGWFDATNKKPTDYASMPANNLVFTSSWTDVDYTVTFVVNGTVTTENYNYGEAIDTPDTPNVPGMNFTGWVCDGVAGIPATMPDHDIVVVAQFGTAFYTVTFLDDVNGSEFDKITVMYGAAITLPAETPTKANHEFVKWLNVPETMPAENIVIVPEFKRVPAKLVPKNDEATTVIDYEEKLIYGLQTNLSETILREQFLKVEGDGYMVINTYNGNYGFYGTGATVDLYDNVLGYVETYTIIVFGDINGDSRINSTDSSMITSEINMTNIDKIWSIEALASYDKYKVMAADINCDDHINTTDKDNITNATLGSVRINQETREVIRADA